MKKNRFSRYAAFLLAAAAMLSTGCAGREPSEPQITSEATAAVTTAVTTTAELITTAALPPQASPAATTGSSAAETTLLTTTSEVTTATAAPVPASPALQPMTEPAVYLDHFEMPGTVWRIIPGIGQTVIMQSDQNGKHVGYIYDLASQRVVREIKLQNTNELLGVFSDGTVVFTNYADNRLDLYTQDAEKPVKLYFTGCSFDFSPQISVDTENQCIYFYDSNNKNMMKMDRDGTITKLFSNERITYMEHIDANRKCFRATAYSDTYASGYAESVFSLETGALLYIMPSNGMSYFAANDQSVNLDNLTFFEGKPVNLNVFDSAGNYLQTYHLPKKGTTEVEICGETASDFVPVSYTKNYVPQNLSYLDLKNGTVADTGLNLTKQGVKTLYHCYNKEAGRWVTAVNTGSGKNQKTRLLMTDPALLKYDNKLETELKPQENHIPVSVGEGYRAVRNKADELEKEFGIRILVGNEVANAEAAAGYNLTSAEGMTDPETAIENLNALHDLLAMYPKDFFDRFKLSDGSHGLRISLPYELENKAPSSFKAAGVAYQTGAWYDIAMQDNCCLSPSTLHHEMWHTVEHLSNSVQMLDDGEWSKLNPKNFQYINNFEKYCEENSYNEYLIWEWQEKKDYSKPYFIEIYSTVTPMEDRATLIETLFTYASDWYTDIQPQDAVAEICKYPHLKSKLDYLAEVSKRTFGYVYWEKMLNPAK